MGYIKIKTEEQQGKIKLYYEDLGHGRPVVFIHGWPLSQEMWEYQINELAEHGLRCIAYDRRGFGKSTKPWEGYEYDNFAADLNAVLTTLDLNDVILIGFAMGGGDIARYIKLYGDERIAKTIFLSATTPFMLQTEDNPEGVKQEVFEKLLHEIRTDRMKCIDIMIRNLFSGDTFNVSPQIMDYFKTLCFAASPKATLDSIKAMAYTDFRNDLEAIHKPTLILHGTGDSIAPIAEAEATKKLIKDATLITYENAPHGMFYTHKEQVNKDMLHFITH